MEVVKISLGCATSNALFVALDAHLGFVIGDAVLDSGNSIAK